MSARKSKSFGSGMPVGVPHMELNIHDQTFKVRGAMSGIRLLHVMSAMEGDPGEGENQKSNAITETLLQFISDSFLTEDRARGVDYLENSDPPVELPTLIEIIQWLVEEYTANPTQQPTPSTDGSAVSGSGSSGNAPSAAAVTYVSSTENNFGQSAQLLLDEQ